MSESKPKNYTLPEIFNLPGRRRIFEILATYRHLFLALYTVFFLGFFTTVFIYSEYVFAELFHVSLNLYLDAEAPWKEFLEFTGQEKENGTTEDGPGLSWEWISAILVLFVALQIGFLWGGGRIKVGRTKANRRQLTVALIITGIFCGALLLGLLLLAIQFAQQEMAFEILDDWGGTVAIMLAVVGTSWLVWFIFGIWYYRGNTHSNVLFRLLAGIFTGSWIEFVLALAIDAASRDRSCPCAPGSWWVLVLSVPILLWCVGPAVYLLYLHERNESKSQPDRSWRILMAKTTLPSNSGGAGINVSNHVSSARTLSVALILLAYFCWELSAFHFVRDNNFSDYRDAVTIDWLVTEHSTDAELESTTNKVQQSPLGEIEVEAFRSNKDGAPVKFKIEVTGKSGEWVITHFSYNKISKYSQILNDLEGELTISGSGNQAVRLERVRKALFHRQIKVPGIDFDAFQSETALWVLSLLVCLGAIIVRSRVRLILLDPLAGHEEPWLILDAKSRIEKIIATLWIFGILIAVWVAIGSLTVSAKNVIKSAEEINLFHSALSFVAIFVMAAAGGWASFMTVIDLLFARRVRQTLFQSISSNDAA